MTTSSKRDWRAWTTEKLPSVLVFVLVAHFGATLLYLTPLNPLKLRLYPQIHAYMVPFFEQRWELFAPDPLVDTRMLLVSCRLVDSQGVEKETPYTNMTAAYRDLKYRYRLTPADRIERGQLASIQLMFGQKDELVRKLLEHPDEDSPAYKKAIEQINAENVKRGSVGARLLARSASAECDRLYKSGRTKDIRVRLVTIKSPPFSQRLKQSSEGETQYADFPWMTYEKVAPL